MKKKNYEKLLKTSGVQIISKKLKKNIFKNETIE